MHFISLEEKSRSSRIKSTLQMLPSLSSFTTPKRTSTPSSLTALTSRQQNSAHSPISAQSGNYPLSSSEISSSPTLTSILVVPGSSLLSAHHGGGSFFRLPSSGQRLLVLFFLRHYGSSHPTLDPPRHHPTVLRRHHPSLARTFGVLGSPRH